MGAFNINITGVGGHGCERKAKAGEKLYGRCGRFTCPDCAAYDFAQRIRQGGMVRDGDIAYTVEIEPGDVDALRYREAEDAYTFELASTDATKPFAQTEQASKLPVFYAEAEKKWYRKVYHSALFTHWPGSPTAVVDDMLKNERRTGQF